MRKLESSRQSSVAGISPAIAPARQSVIVSQSVTVSQAWLLIVADILERRVVKSNGKVPAIRRYAAQTLDTRHSIGDKSAEHGTGIVTFRGY